MKKRFTNYKEIDRAIEIADVERQIHIEKMKRSTSEIVDTFSPSNLLKSVNFMDLGIFKNITGGLASNQSVKNILLVVAVRALVNNLFKKK